MWVRAIILGWLASACCAATIVVQWSIVGLTRLKFYESPGEDPVRTVYLHGSQLETKVEMKDPSVLTLVRATDGIKKYRASVKLDAESRHHDLVHLQLDLMEHNDSDDDADVS